MVCVFATQAFPVLHENKDYHRRVGRTLRRQFGPGQCVFAPNAWVPFFADADRLQFVHRGGLNTTLRSVHLKSPDRLSRAAARTDCDVVYLAVAEQLTDSPVVPRDIIAQILRDRRFRLLGTFASSRRDKIWLFEWMRRFETSTQPAAGAALP